MDWLFLIHHPVVRDVLSVDEPGGRRWDIALELLAEGTPVVCKGLRLHLQHVEPGHSLLTVTVESRWHDSVTAERAESQLRHAETALAELLAGDSSFASIVEGAEREYELIDTYGMGAVLLARLDRSGFRLYLPRSHGE